MRGFFAPTALQLFLSVAVAGAGATLAQAQVENLVVRAGDRSVVLNWEAGPGKIAGYHVYRRTDSASDFERLTSTPVATSGYVDFSVTNGIPYAYVVRAQSPQGDLIPSPERVGQPRAWASDEQFLDYLQGTAFDYFWHEANPTHGLIRDRNTTHSPCSIAAVGFGLTALGIGVERGWVERARAAERTLVTLRTFWNGPQGTNSQGMMGYKGWFYHFLDMTNGARVWNCELSSMDTALFLAGALYAREFYDGRNATEAAIRDLATRLYGRIDWHWMADRGRALHMGWHPETGFITSRWTGYNEAMLLYVLGLGAPAHPLPANHWQGWTSKYLWGTNHNQVYLQFSPLFGHQYSHCWIDFRNITDEYMTERGLTYFENSRRATLAQRAYAIANPKQFAGYSSNVWGLTACDGPPPPRFLGYAARGAPDGPDDGTIAPAAAGGSIPFAPDICLAALRNMYEQYRTRIWTHYGFRDAFNVSDQWWDPDVLGIDQGAMLIMAENYRSQNVWRRFMRNPEIKRGLQAAGFKPLKARR